MMIAYTKDVRFNPVIDDAAKIWVIVMVPGILFIIDAIIEVIKGAMIVSSSSDLS